MDSHQENAVQYQHALSIPGQTPLEAWSQANTFVRDQIDAARASELAGNHADAMDRLGDAMHTMQDATSPSHEGFQQYDNDGPLYKKAEHVSKELWDPGRGSSLDDATRHAWDLFKRDGPLPAIILTRPTN